MNRELGNANPRWTVLKTFGASVSDYLVKAAGAAAGAGLLEVLWP